MVTGGVLTNIDIQANNFSSGNAVITGGYLEGLANVYATEGQFTNVSSGNVIFTGGYLDNTPIGANTPATGAFTTLTASGNIVAGSGTASSNTTTGALVVKGGAGISGDVNIGTSLTVDGGSYGNVTTTQFGSVFAYAYGSNNFSIMQVWSQGTQGLGMSAYGTELYSSGAIAFRTGATLRDKDFATGGTNGVQIAANGAVIALTGIASTSTGTGAVIVKGGVGISGNLNVGGNAYIQNFSTGNAVITGGYLQGLANVRATEGYFTNLSSGNVLIANTSITTAVVTNLSSGNAVITGGYLQGLANVRATEGQFTNLSSGNVILTGGYADNLALGGNIAANANVNYLTTHSITSILDQTNSVPYVMGSGALYVAGGMSVGKDIWVGGNLYVANIISETTTILEVKDPLVYFNPDNPTYNFDIGFFSDFIDPGHGLDNYTGWIRSYQHGYWGAFSNVNTAPASGTINLNDPDLIWDTIKGGELIVANTTAATSTTTGALRVAGGAGVEGKLWIGGNIVADSGTTSIDCHTGAIVVPGEGGVGIGGNLNVCGLSNFEGNITAGNIYLTGNINAIVGAVASQYGVFYGDPVTGEGALFAGVPGFTPVVATVVQFAGNSEVYSEINFENTWNGSSSTTDFVVTADNGTDSIYYGDLGILGSNYDGSLLTSYTNGIGTAGFADDTYLYAHGDPATPGVGGNLIIGTAIPGTVLRTIIGDVNVGAIVTTTTSSGFTINSTTVSDSVNSGALIVNGGAGISGNLFAASINDTPIGNAIPSTGVFTNLTGDTAVFGNLSSGNVLITGGELSNIDIQANNFSTGNAVITGGYAEGLANVRATEGYFTNLSSGNVMVTGGVLTNINVQANNFSSGNAVITGGYAEGLANVRATEGYFTNLSSGNVMVTGGVLTNINIQANNFSSGNAVITGGYAEGLANVRATEGQFTNLSSGNVLITGGELSNIDVQANNFSSGNAVITGGVLSNIDVQANNFSSSNVLVTGGVLSNIDIQANNFSTGNAVITGGYFDNTPIGANTAASGRFSTLEITGAFTIGSSVFGNLQAVAIGNVNPGTGAFTTLSASGNLLVTSQENAVDDMSGALQVAGGVSIVKDLWVNGNAYVQQIGSTLSDSILTASASLLYLKPNIATPYNYDIGVYSRYDDTHYQHTGLVRNHVDGTWYLFSNLSEPSGSTVDFTNTDLVLDGLKAGNLLLANTTASNDSTSGALIVLGGAGISGNINVGGAAVINRDKTARPTIVKGPNSNSLILTYNDSGYDGVLIGGNAVIGSTTVPGAKLQINSTDSILLPVGSTSERPSNKGYTDVAGMLRFNTYTNAIEYYDGASWVNPSVVFTVITSTQFAVASGNPNGNVDGFNVDFILPTGTTTNGSIVSINGVVQLPSSAYTITTVMGTTTLSFTEAPSIGDVIDVRILTTTSEVRAIASANGYNSVVANTGNVQIITGATSANVITSWTTTGAEVNSIPKLIANAVPNTVTLDQFDSSLYSSAEYSITSTKPGVEVEMAKVIVSTDGTTVNINAYARVLNSGPVTSPVSYTVGISTGTVTLTATPTVAYQEFRIKKNYQAI